MCHSLDPAQDKQTVHLGKTTWEHLSNQREQQKTGHTGNLVWSQDCTSLFSILLSWALAFLSSPATRLSVTGCFSAWSNMESNDVVTGGFPICPAWVWALNFSLSFSRSTPSASILFSEGLPFLVRRPLEDKAPTGWTAAESLGEASAPESTVTDFFRPGVFFFVRDSSMSLASIEKRLDVELGEASDGRIFPLLSQSFLPYLLFSFSRSLFFSVSLSFSFVLVSLVAEMLRSLSAFPVPPHDPWLLGVKSGKSCEDEAELPLTLRPPAARRPSETPWLVRPMEPEGKPLKEACDKALAASGLTATSGNGLEFPVTLMGTELLIMDCSEAFPVWTPDWLLLVVIECEGDLGCPRENLDPFLFLFDVGETWSGDREPGLLPDEDGRVTDSKMREWAGLGLKKGGRSRGLRFWSGVSNRDEWCWWWLWWGWWWRGEKSLEPVPAAPPGPWNPPDATPPPPGPGGMRPTSSAVSGGGRKLSKVGLRIRPSFAYLAEEKYLFSAHDKDFQRKVGSRSMERRLSWELESIGGVGRKGAMECDIHGEWEWCSGALDEAPWGGWGGLRRGGGGGEEDDDAVEEACWDPACETPVAGLMMACFLPRATKAPRLWLWPLRPRLLRSINTIWSGSGSDGGDGGCEARCMLASVSPWEAGEWSASSERAWVPSEAWESQEESSRLGLLERDDSPEESWEECCETALEPQDAALLLNLPLLVLLLQLLLRRLAAMLLALPVGTGGGGGGRESTAGPAPGVAVVPLVTGAVETRDGAGVMGWSAGADAAESNRAIFMCGGGVLKLPSSSINRFGVLMMRNDTVLTTGMMNCLMFVSCVRLLCFVPSRPAVPWVPIASFSNSFFFWAPFFARCSSCFAIAASVRLEGGTTRTGLIWRGLWRNPNGLPCLVGVIGLTVGESWISGLVHSSAGWEALSLRSCGVRPLKSCSRRTLKALCLADPGAMVGISWTEEALEAWAAAAAASALRRSAEGGLPRPRLRTPGTGTLFLTMAFSLDLSGLSLTSRNLFSLVTLDSRLILWSLAPDPWWCPEPSRISLFSLSSSSTLSLWCVRLELNSCSASPSSSESAWPLCCQLLWLA